jgi:hypothetical protein
MIILPVAEEQLMKLLPLFHNVGRFFKEREPTEEAQANALFAIEDYKTIFISDTTTRSDTHQIGFEGRRRIAAANVESDRPPSPLAAVSGL